MLLCLNCLAALIEGVGVGAAAPGDPPCGGRALGAPASWWSLRGPAASVSGSSMSGLVRFIVSLVQLRHDCAKNETTLPDTPVRWLSLDNHQGVHLVSQEALLPFAEAHRRASSTPCNPGDGNSTSTSDLKSVLRNLGHMLPCAGGGLSREGCTGDPEPRGAGSLALVRIQATCFVGVHSQGGGTGL